MWLRIYQHLLPQAQAWRITVAKTLRSFFVGLTGLPTDARQYIDDVHDDLYPDSTRQLAEWETQFGLTPSAGATDGDRRVHLAGAWQAQGGQSPRYIQDVLQAAGFPLYVYEWWDPTALPTVTAKNPHTYTNQPLIGEFVCKPTADPAWVCKAKTLGGVPQVQAVCTNWLNNETHYLVNLNLTRKAPPPVPNDSTKYPYFLYVGGSTFPTHASIPVARRGELEALLLKLRPSQNWVVTLIDYV